MTQVSDTLRNGDAFYGAAQQSDGGDKGFPLAKIAVYEFGAIVAANASGMAAGVSATGTTISCTGTLVNASTGIATFDIPRAVSLYSSSSNGITFTITGTDAYNQAQTEYITGPTTTGIVNGAKAFKSVSSVTCTGGAGLISVGTSDIWGLPYRVGDKGKFLGLRIDGADAAPTIVTGLTTTGTSTATTADVRGTITATTASNGAKLFTAIMLVVPTNKTTLYGVAPA